MTNKEIFNIALAQSAIDSNCKAADFNNTQNKIVLSRKNDNARRYLDLPLMCDLTSYGSNIVASVSQDIKEIINDYISRFSAEQCFETPNIHILTEALKPYDINVCFMAEYFLPDMNVMKPISSNYETKILTNEDFASLYLPQWGNALCADRKHLDVLGVGAYDNGQLIGLAGCSADCDTMWQIGVDVLPQYRRQGIASCLTNKLAYEIMSKNIVPFYCCAWANIKSARNAIKSGFKPAWVQLTVKSNEFISTMLK